MYGASTTGDTNDQTGDSDGDSLFDTSKADHAQPDESGQIAQSNPKETSDRAVRRLPDSVSIDGLYFDPDVQITESLALELLREIKQRDYFRGGRVNQLMLFERSYDDGSDLAEIASGQLPVPLLNLISNLDKLLEEKIPKTTHQLLFPKPSLASRIPARQAILNLYRPGEGITPHVDLLKRFGDGIIIISLGSGTVMQLAHLDSPARVNLWLEPRSILILEREARYRWTHGIPSREGDWVDDDLFEDPANEEPIWIPRDVRVSITLRWLLQGAEIVGEASIESTRA